MEFGNVTETKLKSHAFWTSLAVITNVHKVTEQFFGTSTIVPNLATSQYYYGI